ncbi:uncharacterized protein LOC116412948, partial [Galleria mellonella]|uniref:Uncharacterized protein LOC116412948 n=1 Tax=Galleria mellonella TaxID=7137 RepID=A0A6J3BUL1_GALME
CGGCNEEIKRQRVKCPKCKKDFHQLCVNFQSNKVLPTTKIAEGWSCPDCIAKLGHKGDNSSTPLKPPSDNNKKQNESDEDDTDQGEILENYRKEAVVGGTARDTLKDEIIAALRSELPLIIQNVLKSHLSPISNQLEKLQNSVTFLSERYEEFYQKLEGLSAKYRLHEEEYSVTRKNVQKLTDQISDLEQRLRESNLEINGITESKSENLLSVIKQIADVSSYALDNRDILSVTRVAKYNKDNKKPRSIVVKLRSPRQRDEFISAIHRYNKSHPNDRLNTGLIGVPGETTAVYVSEHLSPANKALHAAARLKAKEKLFKYVWVRNGRIYTRKDENTRYISIKNIQSLELMK